MPPLTESLTTTITGPATGEADQAEPAPEGEGVFTDDVYAPDVYVTGE